MVITLKTFIQYILNVYYFCVSLVDKNVTYWYTSVSLPLTYEDNVFSVLVFKFSSGFDSSPSPGNSKSRRGGGWTTTSHHGLFLLRGLRSLGVQVVLLGSLCGGTICPVWSWTGSISARDKKRLDRLIRKVTSVQGSLQDRGEGRQLICHPWWRREAYGSFTDRRLQPTCGENYI